MPSACPRIGERAGVAKLEYARDLGSRGRETVRVRIPPSAPKPEEQGSRQKAVNRNKQAMMQ